MGWNLYWSIIAPMKINTSRGDRAFLRKPGEQSRTRRQKPQKRIA